MKLSTKRIVSLATILLVSITAWAQHLAGTVTDSVGTPISDATVVELDINHRIVNSTTSDNTGHFAMQLSPRRVCHIRISAQGYSTLHQRVEKGHLIQTFMMAPKRSSRLEQEVAKSTRSTRNFQVTEKLLCGRANGREVPWLVMLEQINDSVFALRLPVRASGESSRYPEERAATFLNVIDDNIVQMLNGEDVIPQKGNPNNKDMWKDITQDSPTRKVQRNWGDESDEEQFYFYVPFLLSLNEINLLIEKTDVLERLLIENEHADNFWIMYPRKTFASELRKLVTKLTAWK